MLYFLLLVKNFTMLRLLVMLVQKCIGYHEQKREASWGLFILMSDLTLLRAPQFTEELKKQKHQVVITKIITKAIEKGAIII